MGELKTYLYQQLQLPAIEEVNLALTTLCHLEEEKKEKAKAHMRDDNSCGEAQREQKHLSSTLASNPPLKAILFFF